LPESLDWFRVSSSHLEEAENCFQRKRYAHALFWLQQANETLAKGLLESLRFMKSDKADSWITTLKDLGLDFTVLSPQQYGHSYGESFFSAMEKSLQSFESGLPTALESPKLGGLNGKSADILKGYTAQFKNWPERLDRARKAYRSAPTERVLGEIIRSCDEFVELLDDVFRKGITLSDLKSERQLAGSTFLVEAVEVMARKAGIKMDPELSTIYVKIFLSVPLLLVVTLLGGKLAPYEANVRYPEGYFKVTSENAIVRNFSELVALHRKCLAIVQTAPFAPDRGDIHFSPNPAAVPAASSHPD